MTDAREESEDSAERWKHRAAAAAVSVGKDRPGESRCSLSVCLCLSLSVCLCLSLSVSLCLSLSLSVSL